MSSLASTHTKLEDLSGTTHEIGNPELMRWQRKLLPFMTSFVVGMALAFFCFSALHLRQVTRFIEEGHGPDVRAQIQAEIDKKAAVLLSSDQVTQHALLILEADARDNRYHHFSALLLSRIWTKQLAFMTGMILAFLGAVFILGKLSESGSKISGGASAWSFSIASASPGIILSFFGTVLLIVSLVVEAPIREEDRPVYLGAAVPSVGAPAPAAPGSSAASPVAEEPPPDTIDLGKHRQRLKTAPPPLPAQNPK